jgi:8-oxo-dGTP diphosphatase
MQLTTEDKQFLATYKVEKYDRPSVAIDVVMLCLNEFFELMVLATKRTEPPFKDKLQLPGGFVDINKDLDTQVKDIVKAKTGFNTNVISFEQLYTYGKVDRDPRTRVISVTYFAILPQNALYNENLCDHNYGWVYATGPLVPALAFDHNDILNDAIKRITNKIDYTDLAFDFLKSRSHFTLFELKQVYEAFSDHDIDLANFRRDILKRYKDKFELLEGIESTDYSKRPSKVYKYDN